MISIKESITTPKPIDEVFAYIADFATAAEWDPGLISSERTSGDGGVGTTYAVVARFRGREVPMTYEVLAHEPPRKIMLRGSGSAAEAIDTIEFSEEDGGTRVVYGADFRMQGLLRFAEPFMRGMFDDLGKKALAGMKRALDG